MLEHAVEPENAETIFQRKLREKLAARGYEGDELECKVAEEMAATIRFRLDLGQEPSGTDGPSSLSIMDLQGLGKEFWQSIDPAAHVASERDARY